MTAFLGGCVPLPPLAPLASVALLTDKGSPEGSDGEPEDSRRAPR